MSDFRKSVVFEAKLNTDSFGPTIEGMKRQFNEAANAMNAKQAQGQTSARLSQQGYGGIMSLPKPEDIQKTRRAMDIFIREQAQQQEKLYKLTEKQNEKVERLHSIKKGMLNDSKEQLKVEERILAAKERLNQMNEQYRKRDVVLNQAMAMQGGRGGIVPPTNTNPAPGTGGNGSMGAVGNFLLGGSMMSVAAGMAKAVDTLAGFPMRLEEARGSAAQSFAGRDITAMQSGASAFETPWMQERAKAAEMAQDKRLWNQKLDRFLGTTSALSIGLGAVLTATGVAAPLGLGMMGAGALGLHNDRNRSAMFGMDMGHNELLNKQQGTDTLATWESLRQQDPRKGGAIDYLKGNYAQNLQMQRMMGMGDQGYLGAGGFLQGGAGAGFDPTTMNAMAMQMQAGGGSTRGMRGGSMLAAQAQRGFDLTNAGSALGRISGAAGGSEQSNRIFQKMIEEGMKAGLDRSEFREEQRKFVDTTSEILSRSGVKTAEEAEKDLQGFSKYVGGDATMRGLEGAKGSYQEEQAFSGQTSGRGGAIQFAEMLKDPILKGLSPAAMSRVGEMQEADLNPSNGIIIALAHRQGVTPEEFANHARGVKFRTKVARIQMDPNKTEQAYGKLAAMGISEGQQLSTSQLDALQKSSPEDYKTFQDLIDRSGLENEYGGPQKGESDVWRYSSGGRKTGAIGGRYEQGMATGETARSGDEAVRALGGAAELTVKNFMELRDAVTPNVIALEKFLNAILSLNTAMSTGVTTKEALERYMKANPLGNQKQVSGKRQQ